MINSLLKDSHITHLNRAYSQNSASGHQKQNRQYSGSVSEKFSKVPAQTSFSGLYCSKQLEHLKIIETLENSKVIEDFSFRTFFDSAKKFIAPSGTEASADKKTIHNSTKELINKVIDFVQNPGQKADESVEKFMQDESNSKKAKNFLEDVKAVIKNSKAEAQVDPSSPEYKEVLNKSVNEAVDVLHSVEEPGKFYTNKTVKKIFEKAEKNQTMFTAGYSLLLAGALRPATIVSLPGKKNKDDMKYAAAHSISSGVMGYLAALIISTPIAAAIKKIADNPGTFLDEKTTAFFADKKPAKAVVGDVAKKARQVAEDAFQLGETKRFGIARKYLNMIPNAITSVPQAIITIALIPVILKYVFGLERKSHSVAKEATPTPQNPPVSSFKTASGSVKNVFKTFMGETK